MPQNLQFQRINERGGGGVNSGKVKRGVAMDVERALCDSSLDSLNSSKCLELVTLGLSSVIRAT